MSTVDARLDATRGLRQLIVVLEDMERDRNRWRSTTCRVGTAGAACPSATSSPTAPTAQTRRQEVPMADDHEHRPCGCRGRYYSGVGWEWDRCALHEWLADQGALTAPCDREDER